MSATRIGGPEHAQVWHADHPELADRIDVCDLLLVDPPYSERTHAGHGDDIVAAPGYDGSQRRTLSYAWWSPDDVRDFVDVWAPRTRGWIVAMCDHVLAPAWEAALADHDRYVFAPLPFVQPGSGVRRQGDGPSSWTRWIVVARPTSRYFSRWGTTRGAYLADRGQRERLPIVGGKPVWLLEQLVSDYSRPGQLVVDPCCGAGSALLASARLGRRSIGGDVDLATAQLAAARLVEAAA